jgi:hypothetical protein
MTGFCVRDGLLCLWQRLCLLQAFVFGLRDVEACGWAEVGFVEELGWLVPFEA